MKVQPINNSNYNMNISHKGVNKFCKYSIGSLIASTTLFMLSNAVDTFRPEKVSKDSIGCLNMAASLLGIAGTGLGIFGLEKVDSEDENR